MAGKDPPSLTLWDFLLLVLLYRMFLLRFVYTLHPHQCLLSNPSTPDYRHIILSKVTPLFPTKRMSAQREFGHGMIVTD